MGDTKARMEMLQAMFGCNCSGCKLFAKISTTRADYQECLEEAFKVHSQLSFGNPVPSRVPKERTHVFINTRFVAFHNWLGATGSFYYLKNLHRHEFHVKMWFPVNHDDRDIEFCNMKEQVDNWILLNYSNKKLVNKSCEMMAKELASQFNATTVEVSEDGENGAIYHRS